jgi:ribosomal protein L40E
MSNTSNGYVTGAVLFIGIAALVAILIFTQSGCQSTPPSCLALCERVEAWAKACNKPMVFGNAANCAETYSACKWCGSRNDVDANERRCWSKMLEYKDEIDCNKPPEFPL